MLVSSTTLSLLTAHFLLHFHRVPFEVDRPHELAQAIALQRRLLCAGHALQYGAQSTLRAVAFQYRYHALGFDPKIGCAADSAFTGCHSQSRRTGGVAGSVNCERTVIKHRSEFPPDQLVQLHALREFLMELVVNALLLQLLDEAWTEVPAIGLLEILGPQCLNVALQ